MNETLGSYHQTAGMIASEKEIIDAARKDPGQFAALYRKYHQPIFLFVLKRVESMEIASDITSQVFLKALVSLSAYRHMGLPFSSWLFRIARNELYDMHRAKKVQLVVSIENKGIAEMIAEMGENVAEVHEELHAALERLEDPEMELIELRFFEKRPFREIGEILEITENNAKVRTYRVLDKIRNLLKNEG